VALVRERYRDFGPTFAHQKLTEEHEFACSVETVRGWMTTAGLWVPRAQRLRRSQPPRPRRACLGELVQIDGSEHAWFEDRGPVCTLLVYVDDATSRLMELAFAEVESTFDYFRATRRYLERHGKPMAFSSDRLSVCHVAKRDAAQGGPGVSQFGRARQALNIDSLCATTAAATGRVERANPTLQERLVQELRLRGLNDPAAAEGWKHSAPSASPMKTPSRTSVWKWTWPANLSPLAPHAAVPACIAFVRPSTSPCGGHRDRRWRARRAARGVNARSDPLRAWLSWASANRAKGRVEPKGVEPSTS
jgi:hypothetical protein